MTLAQKVGWTRRSSEWLAGLKNDQEAIDSGHGQEFDYYGLPRSAFCYATSCYLERDMEKAAEAARLVVDATLDYFYGSWRRKFPAPSGKADPEEWRRCCLWHEVVVESLPFACALGDWKSVKLIAEYPVDESFPEAGRVRGETAWTRALICYLRGEPRVNVESLLAKAEQHKSQRPKLLAPVLRALLKENGVAFERTLLAYLEYYRKRDFKLTLHKIVTLEGTTLYHVGRKHGFKVGLPDELIEHVIRLK